MSKLSNLSDKDIHEAIEAMQNGIAIKPNGEEARVLRRSIDRALDELKRRAEQKKSEEPQSPIKTVAARVAEATKQQVREWAGRVERDAQNQQLDQVETVRNFERVTVGRAAEITVTIPVVEVKIAGKIKVLTQTEIVGLLKTYFKGVATGREMEKGNYTEAYASEMGKAVWRLFDGWNIIYKQTQEGTEWPPMEDIFPGFARASQQYKICADVLWRWASNRSE